ncbi:hypothetical protein P886_3306 [Alteromonadaceae bacterium 2753L.S.0a.02]|nr:hypothetical protein P886_3306 [Alteromonadaceae bacterium 2753L.S.0a.02]
MREKLLEFFKTVQKIKLLFIRFLIDFLINCLIKEFINFCLKLIEKKGGKFRPFL